MHAVIAILQFVAKPLCGNISAAFARAIEAHASGSGSINVYGNPQQSKLSGRNVRIAG